MKKFIMFIVNRNFKREFMFKPGVGIRVGPPGARSGGPIIFGPGSGSGSPLRDRAENFRAGLRAELRSPIGLAKSRAARSGSDSGLNFFPRKSKIF